MQQYIAKNQKIILNNWQFQQINLNIKHLQNTSQTLMNIAQRIQKSSLLLVQPIPSIIKDIQHQVRVILTNLTTRINDYYIHIKSKIKDIQNKLYAWTQKHLYLPQQTKQTLQSYQKVKQLQSKVAKLQINLKKTQKTQQKLRQIIYGFINKYKIDELPSFIKQNPQCNLAVKNKLIQSKNTSSQPQLETIHQNYRFERPTHFIRKIYSKMDQQRNQTLKRSLKSTSTYYSTSKINKNDFLSPESMNHRLGYLISQIKQNSIES